MRNARIKFGEKSCESLLSEDRGRKGGQRRFMTIDVQFKKSKVTIVLFFFNEGYRGGLVIEEMKKKVNVIFTSKLFTIS